MTCSRSWPSSTHIIPCLALQSDQAAGTELSELQLRSATDYSRATASQEMRGRMSSWSLARPLSARSIPRDEECKLIAQELEAARGLDWQKFFFFGGGGGFSSSTLAGLDCQFFIIWLAPDAATSVSGFNTLQPIVVYHTPLYMEDVSCCAPSFCARAWRVSQLRSAAEGQWHLACKAFFGRSRHYNVSREDFASAEAPQQMLEHLRRLLSDLALATARPMDLARHWRAADQQGRPGGIIGHWVFPSWRGA